MELDKEKIIKDTVHKTLARVKIRCSRVVYPDRTTGEMQEMFTISAKDLDKIETELLKGSNHYGNR